MDRERILEMLTASAEDHVLAATLLRGSSIALAEMISIFIDMDRLRPLWLFGCDVRWVAFESLYNYSNRVNLIKEIFPNEIQEIATGYQWVNIWNNIVETYGEH